MTYDSGDSADVPEEAFEWLIVWRCFLDACPICQNLNGYPFSGIGDIPPILVHPQWGHVWNVDAGFSLTHPNCRCTLSIYVRIDFSKIPRAIEVSKLLGIDCPEIEMFEVTDIQTYRDTVKGIRADFGSIHSDAREIEYILYRVTGMLGRMGLPPQVDKALFAIQNTVMTARMIDSTAMYLATGTTMGLAMGAITGTGALMLTGAFLTQMGQQNWKAAVEAANIEQLHSFLKTQLELRRQRY